MKNRKSPILVMVILIMGTFLFNSSQLVNSNVISQPVIYGENSNYQTSTLKPYDNGENCSVNCGFILDVLGKDAIPSIDNPKFVSSENVEEIMEEEDIVLGIVVNGVPHAFPLDILDWHEVVNADIGGRNIALTYCPLTATGITYDRSSIGGSEIGVSGKLYENNLVFYDRDTNQYWLQMYGEVIKGDEDKLGTPIKRLPIIETTWRAWNLMYPDTQVLSRDTGIYHPNLYKRTAYPGYDTREDTLFRSSYNETAFPDNLYSRKNRSLILTIDNTTRLYPYQKLANFSVVNDELANEPILIVFDELNRLAIPFSAKLESGTLLRNFTQAPLSAIGRASNYLPVFQDESGTLWNFKGEAIDGQFEGEKLNQIPAYTGYWFAAMAMYPDAEIFPLDTNSNLQANTVDWANRPIDINDRNLVTTILLIGTGVAIVLGIIVVLRLAYKKRALKMQ